MKFDQFIAKFDLTATKYGLGFFVYSQEMSLDARQAIFTLTDYKVSSIACGQYFLLPV